MEILCGFCKMKRMMAQLEIRQGNSENVENTGWKEDEWYDLKFKAPR
jgi:hypothetical protein